MPITVTPLENDFGAVITGVDPSRPLTQADFAVIHRALVDHIVFVIPDLPLEFGWLLDLCRRFGPLVPHILNQYHHPDSSECSVISMNTGDAFGRSTGRPAGSCAMTSGFSSKTSAIVSRTRRMCVRIGRLPPAEPNR